MLLHALMMAAAALGQADSSVDDAGAELSRYYSAAIERLSEMGEEGAKARTKLQKTQHAFYQHRDIKCEAGLGRWPKGSIADKMADECSERLTRARTHSIWSDWLSSVDSTHPILPEPPLAD